MHTLGRTPSRLPGRSAARQRSRRRPSRRAVRTGEVALYFVRQELQINLKLPQGRIHPACERRAPRGALVHLGLDLRVLP